jgi:hypothetical protein
MTIVRSYWTLTRVWRSKNVSGSRKERISPDPPGAEAVLASAIESGQTQCPSSLLLDAPSEGEGTRGASGDFDQMGWIWFRKTKESPMFEPVMIRPVTYGHLMKFASKEKRLETYHRRNRLDRVTPLGIEFEPTSNIFLLKECGQRLRRLCAAKDPKRDPRLRLSICNLEDVLCRLTTEVNGLSKGITTGIWGELRARGWCRTRSNGESPVAGRGRRVHGEGKDMESLDS